MPGKILTHRDGAIATVSISHPERMNAMTRAMWGQLGDAINDLSLDDAVRCIIVRGDGTKSFSPGNDISKFEEERGSSQQAKDYSVNLERAFHALQNCRHPLLAVIDGICVGGGLAIASLCDIRVCSDKSRFGVPINKLGLVMAHDEIKVLLDLVGKDVTLEILLEGGILDAQEAKDRGLVSRIFPNDKIGREGMAIAEHIADGAPLVARWHKQFIRQLEEGRPLTEEERDEGYACYETDDFQTGYRAFLAKEKPKFKGS